MSNVKARDHLIKLMESSSAPSIARVGAAEGLGYIGGSVAIDHLIKAMETVSWPHEVRAAAAKALGMAASKN